MFSLWVGLSGTAMTPGPEILENNQIKNTQYYSGRELLFKLERAADGQYWGQVQHILQTLPRERFLGPDLVRYDLIRARYSALGLNHLGPAKQIYQTLLSNYHISQEQQYLIKLELAKLAWKNQEYLECHVYLNDLKDLMSSGIKSIQTSDFWVLCGHMAWMVNQDLDQAAQAYEQALQLAKPLERSAVMGILNHFNLSSGYIQCLS
jgi:hypothetical protein